jgi:uncharacterized BrkB/YihY/UPF0761 family membrane protein
MGNGVDVPVRSVRTEDWPAQATDTIVKVVGTASDKVTGPITTVARAIVFGLFAALLGTAALVLVAILAARVLDNYLPDSLFGEQHMWAAHLVLGLVFSLAGLFLWTKRKPRPAAA